MTKGIYQMLAEYEVSARHAYKQGNIDLLKRIRSLCIVGYDNAKAIADQLPDTDDEALVAYGNIYWTLCDFEQFIYMLDDLIDE